MGEGVLVFYDTGDGENASLSAEYVHVEVRLLSVNILIPDVGFVCHEFSDEGAVTSLEPFTENTHTEIHFKCG